MQRSVAQMEHCMSKRSEIQNHMYNDAVSRMRIARMYDEVLPDGGTNVYFGRAVADLLSMDVFGDLTEDAYVHAYNESAKGIGEAKISLIVGIDEVFDDAGVSFPENSVNGENNA